MGEHSGCEVIDLQRRAGGVAGGIRTELPTGRASVTTASLDPGVQIIGSDPWGTPQFTGVIVPTAATSSLAAPAYQNRYLILLAKVRVNRHTKARLKGLRQYASLIGYGGVDEPNAVPNELQITSPLWRFPDGNISWHVMQYNTVYRDTRNPDNNDSVAYLDAQGPAVLYLTAPGKGYTAPNGGRPWGKPLASDLGNIHDLRYPWRDSQTELALDIPLDFDGDVAVFASVAQHDADATLTLSADQKAAAAPEDRFWNAFSSVQYGRVAASLIIEQEAGK